MLPNKNYRYVLKERPGANNEPSVSNFRFEECSLPTDLQDGEITIKTLYLSVDPALRCRMNEDTGVDYMRAWQLGETVLGLGGVGVVIETRSKDFQPGDLVQSHFNWPWTVAFKWSSNVKNLTITKVDRTLVGDRPQLLGSVFGLTGFTAYLGVMERGHVTPGTNQTFVVSGAAGACGNLAGQIARILGSYQVVGICGSDSKCAALTADLGFSHAINYKTEDLAERLRAVCPNGIDAYYDNVGGEISEVVIKQMNPKSHVVLVGQIAVYNKDLPYPPPISEELQQIITEKNIHRERFFVGSFSDKYVEAMKQLVEWVSQGKLKVPEYVHEGLESAAVAFCNMMTGVKQEKVGKQMIHVADV